MEILLKIMRLKNYLTIVFVCLLFFFPTTVAAQTSFSSNSFVTKVGNAPEDKKPQIGLSDGLVAQFMSNLQSSCGDRIQSSNQSCLDKISPPLSSSVKKIIEDSIRDGGGSFQCVGLVQAILNRKLPVNAAFQLITAAVSGYTFIPNTGAKRVVPGDLPVWGLGDNRPAGHVAYVVRIIDDESFEVAEANIPNSGIIRLSAIIYNDKALAGWLSKNK